MIYPLDNWKTLTRGYTYGVPTFYNSYHSGLDFVVPENTPIYAHLDGQIVAYTKGEEGGNTLLFRGDDGVLVRYLHLSKAKDTPFAKKGDIIAYTGDTGSITTGPHLHIDVWPDGVLDLKDYKDKTLDPEIYFKEDIMELTEWEQNAIKWAKKEGIIENPESAPFDLKQVAWLAEVLRKSKKKV